MWKAIVLGGLLLCLGAAVVAAQTDDCPAIVETALQSSGELCGLLGRNTACYGASMVDSTAAVQPPPEDFFDAPGERAELAQFREIRPQPLDLLSGQFGVAVLNAQANLPNTLPGQGVTFLLMGDARITNEVPANSAEQTPFQSFYFLPGPGRSRCYEAEPMLTIQTPGNTSVTLNFNGAVTEFSPSTLLTITPSVCTIHRGYITRGSGENRANLLANQTVDIHIEPNGTIVVEGARGISEREYQRGQQIQAALNALAKANDWQAQYLGSAPEQFASEPVKASDGILPTPTPATTTQPTCVAQYTTDTFDTLSRIARRFGTTVQAIAAANNIADPNLIYAGETLCIPG